MAMEWKVFSNPVQGVGTLYSVGRKLRQDEPLHGGNVEYATEGSFSEKQLATELAETLNKRS